MLTPNRIEVRGATSQGLGRFALHRNPKVKLRSVGVDDPYRDRLLVEGHPQLEQRALASFKAAVDARPDDTPRVERLLHYLGRIVDVGSYRTVLVLGCGPRPQVSRILLEKGYQVVGVDPSPAFVDEARRYLGDSGSVLLGAAEGIPLPDASQDLVFFESVLEHVDSVSRSLKEIERVLNPGGALYLSTTNRYRFSLFGYNGEYNVRFFNWLPRSVKESFVFLHLHYAPELANYAVRPAVHWLSYGDLCALGREAGFARFYTMLDVVRPNDEVMRSSAVRRLARRFLPRVQRNAWLRSLVLSQRGSAVIMLKRDEIGG
jgi:SAM-dependent methyltransferase